MQRFTKRVVNKKRKFYFLSIETRETGGESWPQMRDMSFGEAGGVESWM